jgi:hypothetical protein
MNRFVATGGVLAALLCGTAGCRKEATKDMSVELERLANRACACTNAACAEQVIGEFVAFMEKHQSASADKQRTNEAASRLGQCVIQAGMSLEKLKTQMQKLQKLDD